jgi:hypothetical protein
MDRCGCRMDAALAMSPKFLRRLCVGTLRRGLVEFPKREAEGFENVVQREWWSTLVRVLCREMTREA